MSKRFAGTHRNKVEDRGRVSLPSTFRKVLATLDTRDLFLIPQMKREDAHVVFSGPGFETYCDRVEQTLTTPQDREAFDEYVQGRAVPLEADEAGRIVLAASIRQMLGIGKELVFVGLGNHFEIRAPEVHDERLAAAGEKVRSIIAEVPMSGLH
jgi:MraZ protein